MSHHTTHGLLVYIDAQPDEQLQRSNLTLCLTGLICDQDAGLVDLIQFKDTPISDRVSEANRLETAIRSGEITVRSISMVAPYSDIERYAVEAEGKLANVMSRRGKRYVVEGKRLSRNTALAMIWYAVGQNLIGLAAAKWAKSLGLDRVTLFLDSLPGAPNVAMKLLRKIAMESELAQLWLKTVTDTGVEFQIGNMGSWRVNAGEPEQSPIEHPHFILTDWIAHSLFASFEDNQEHFTAKHPQLSDEEKSNYLEAIKGPWFALHEMEKHILVSLKSLTGVDPDNVNLEENSVDMA